MRIRFVGLFILFPLSCAALAHAISEQTSSEKALHEYYNLQKGQRLYEQYCRLCHGEEGKGKAYDVVPPPADLTSSVVQNRSDAELAKIIHGGERGTAMGAWNWALTEQDRQNVVQYIRWLGRSKGDDQSPSQ